MKLALPARETGLFDSTKFTVMSPAMNTNILLSFNVNIPPKGVVTVAPKLQYREIVRRWACTSSMFVKLDLRMTGICKKSRLCDLYELQ